MFKPSTRRFEQKLLVLPVSRSAYVWKVLLIVTGSIGNNYYD